jgi:hypothetical protein
MKYALGLALAATCAPEAAAQTCPGNYTPQVSTGTLRANRLVYPFAAPFRSLLPQTAHPDGYPVASTGNWPVSVAIGDIDNDGELDLLYQIEQRLLLAVGFTRNSCGVPISAHAIWAIFDPLGDVNKVGWGRDRPVIWDIDGDGLNEVAWVAHVQTAGSYDLALQVIDDNTTLTPDPSFYNVPRPSIAASWLFSTQAPGWGGRIRNPGSPDSILLTPGRFRAGTSVYDLLVASTQDEEPRIVVFNPAAGTLTTQFALPWQGQGTHDPHVFDLNGDGTEEILTNGVVDPNGPSWRLCSYYAGPAAWTCSTGWHNYDHADSLQPIADLNLDGVLDVVMVDDGYTKVGSGAPLGLQYTLNGFPMFVPSWGNLLRHNTSAPAQHGQTVAIGRWVAGTDVFGYSGPQALFTPKGAPYSNGSGQTWGSYMANRNLDSLASAIVTSPWNGNQIGPVGWNPHAIDWDGDRSQDEVFSPFGDVNGVFRLATATGTFPYAWQLVHEAKLWGRTYGSNMFVNAACDFFGDSREEWLAFGPEDVIFIDNPAAYPNAGKHPSPWRSLEYRRRYSGPITRYVDFQALPTLVKVEVQPAALGMSQGDTTQLTAIGYYSDGSTEDVTAYTTWTSGATGVASFSGNTVTALADGIAAVRATVAGIASNSPALIRVSGSTAPKVLYAGWADTFLVANTASTLKVEAAVADSQGDVIGLALLAGSSTISFGFVDDGSNGDRVANDGVWTLNMPVNLPSTGDSYFEVVAVDAQLNFSERWPYLKVPGANPVTPVPGAPLFPFASEAFGTPLVRIDGVGVLEQSLSGGGGTVTFGARISDPRLQAINLYWSSVDLGVGFNDSGVSGDQLAGDGLWTRVLSVPSGSFAPGEHCFDFAGLSTLPGGGPVSDAHPRLRVH